MKKRIIFGLLILTLIAVPLFLAACEEEVTPPGEEEEGPPPAEEEEEEANWWDEFGEPEYGGTIAIAPAVLIFWDPYLLHGGVYPYYLEQLWMPDWTLDRQIWSFSTMFNPAEYYQGLLAESWEQTDPTTITVHIRQGVNWQDKEPVNGREFTAYDVEYHYDRLLGTGSGFTEPDPFYIGRLGALQKVTATDEYTVDFKFSSSSPWNIYTIMDQSGQNCIVPRETAKPGEPLTDWHNAVGTGPWIVTDYVDGTSLTLDKNPNYWGHDERHPQNQLPYADQLKVLTIPDPSTQLAAIRSDQICFLDSISWQKASTLAETNPELQQAQLPNVGQGLLFRVDREPFTDIRVRKALQMAIDLETIAQSHFGGTADELPCGVVHPLFEGCCFAYEDWPQELKDEYGYNPEGARQLLAEVATDGVFEVNDLGGFDTNIVISSASDTDLELAQIIQSYFLDIGVDMEIRVMEPAALNAFASAGEHDQMYWDTGGNSGLVISPSQSLAFYTSTSKANFGCVNDPAYDALFNEFWGATTMDEAMQRLVEMDRYILEQHWGLKTIPTTSYNVWQPYLKGYSSEKIIVVVGQSGGWSFARLWIDQDLKAMGQ